MAKSMQNPLAQGKKFKDLVEKAGGHDKSAAISGRSVAQLKRYEKGDDPPLSVIAKLCDAAGVTLGWFDESKPLVSFGFSSKEQEAFAPSGHMLAPVPVMNLTASAGHGSVVLNEETSGIIAFSREWLHQQGLSPADLFSMPTMGESMEPTIKAGEFVLCSTAEHHLKPGDGIFVVRLEGDILVKRLQRLPGGVLQVSSDNSAFYKPFNVQINDGTDFLILGKVVIVHGARRV